MITFKAIAVGLAVLLAQPARAEVIVSHGLSAFGELKYGEDFAHFDYADPGAPKGGTFRTTPVLALQTFDSFNAYILKGDAAEGLAAPFDWVYDSLMAQAMDEPDSYYGLVAEHVEYPPSRDWVIFQMREAATFSDGTPVRAEDVAFTLDALKTDGHPAYKLALRDVAGAQALSPLRVKFTFEEGSATRDLPMLVASLPIFSKAFYADRDFAESSLDLPVGSGPYALKRYERGLWTEYHRRPDYWAADLPVNRGRYNFDVIRYEYHSTREASLEALVAGDVDFREEFFSKLWATRYDFPAIERGDVVKDTIPDSRPAGTQGYWINTRREKFSDPRVREAIGLAFDFEWSNKTLFYDLYTRTDSFFENAPFEADGMPTDAELALLEPFRDQLSERVFGKAIVPNVTRGTGRLRRELRRAAQLLDAAGWPVAPDGLRRNVRGDALEIEFLDNSASFARITNPFIQNLETLGISATLRQIDRPQYERRRKAYDYDIVTARLNFALTPGPSLFNTFSSDAAANDGSNNLAGISDPVVDALLEQVIAAQDRDSLHTALRALDRVLRAGFYWVPQWSKASHTIAYWDMFGRPKTKPAYARGVMDLWWVDAAKAEALGRE